MKRIGRKGGGVKTGAISTGKDTPRALQHIILSMGKSYTACFGKCPCNPALRERNYNTTTGGKGDSAGVCFGQGESAPDGEVALDLNRS